MLRPNRRQLGLTVALGGCVSLLLGHAPVFGAKKDSPALPEEYVVKAAILFNFIKLVEWPATMPAPANEPIRVGLLGHAHCCKPVADALEGKLVRQRPLRVRQFSDLKGLEECQVVFLARDEKARLKPLLEKVNGKSILTIGECEGFVEAGGVINLVVADRKVRYYVNPAAAERAGLKLSADLLRLGMVVKAGETAPPPASPL